MIKSTGRNSVLIFFIISSLNLFAQKQYEPAFPDSIDRMRLNTTIGIEVGSYLAGLSILNYIWYKDHERVPFHFYDDSKGYLQMDKWGHAFTAYKESHAAYYALRKAGVNKRKALLYGGPMGLVFQTPIEVFDGLFEGWGFSWSDMIANALGSALFVVQESVYNEQIFLMKFSYSPSIYPDYHKHLGKTHFQRFFLDYNAHTYWISGNLKQLTGGSKIPPWLNVAFGYSANGMIYEFHNPEYYRGEPFPHLDRYRQYLLSLDVDFNKIYTDKKWLKILFKTLNHIKIPFPALEYNRINGIQFKPLYF